MREKLLAQIKSAVTDWVRAAYDSDEMVIGTAAEDDIESADGTRYLVDFAVRQEGQWLVAEVWVEDGTILEINDVGEGLPLENSEWPWPTSENN
jgi:hypothetical protein